MIVLKANKSLQNVRQSVVSIGNFDGMHKGHQALITAVAKQARAKKATSVIITFGPHTKAILHPDKPLHLLTTCAEKELLLRETGIDILACLPFTRELAAMEPQQFIEKVLIKRFKAIGWIMGDNHVFGRNKQGSKEFLHQYTSKKHFTIFPVALRSSSSILTSRGSLMTKTFPTNFS